MQMGLAASGHVRVVKHKASGEITQELEFDNAVLDAGMRAMHDYLMTDVYVGHNKGPINWFRHLFLGTGTTEPTRADVGLEARDPLLAAKYSAYGRDDTRFYGSSVPDVSYQDNDNYVYWTQIEYRFDYGEGEAEGVWTELGLCWDTSYNNPTTRALFRDENGNPISLTILSDEFLTVYYTIRLYDTLGEPKQGSFDLNGAPVNFTLRALGNGWTAPINQWMYSADTGIWGPKYPFVNMRANVGETAYTRSYDVATNTATFTLMFDPSTSDYSISYLYLSGSDNSTSYALYRIDLETPITKRADYRVTLTIDLSFTILGNPIVGVTLDSATANSLTFGWDAYPDATQYQLKLRQAGTEIATQTVTPPTVTATFSGLTASTEYHLAIYAETTGADSAREVVAGSTTA